MHTKPFMVEGKSGAARGGGKLLILLIDDFYFVRIFKGFSRFLESCGEFISIFKKCL